MDWFIVHTYSGFEDRVVQELTNRIKALGMERHFGEIRVPKETVVEMRGGKRKNIERKFFPGYVLVQMEMSDETWHLVRNTPKVTGFVGGSSKSPVPLTQDEVNAILHHSAESREKPKPKYVYERGEQVKIIDGPFKEFTGSVEDINLERSTLRVLVTIFGRPTPVELEFVQVQKL
ncbi:MAG: transcription termination/antitermination protein NusG [Acidithiobacillales bacterium]